MKKLALLFAGSLLTAGVALAGCPGHSDLTMAKMSKAQEVLLVVQLNGMQLEEVRKEAGTPVYNVKSDLGQLVAKEITKDELSQQFPDLHKALAG
ncbi:MAG: hypothetical protein ACO4AU_01895 [bacterium]|jgi:hypothetical protein